MTLTFEKLRCPGKLKFGSSRVKAAGSDFQISIKSSRVRLSNFNWTLTFEKLRCPGKLKFESLTLTFELKFESLTLTFSDILTFVTLTLRAN